jgi:phospholipid/cholesterol/gamma-HCH transport system permease protein
MSRGKYIFTKGFDEFFKEVYRATKFTLLFFKELFKLSFHLREVIIQCYEIGLKALPLISVTGFVVGVIFTQNSRSGLESFGAESWLPPILGIAIVRALGPLTTAIVCAGKVGSGLGAELASMKVTEQIDVMEVSAINPFKFLVVNRVLATIIAILILVFYCSFLGLLGAYLNILLVDNTNIISFYQNAFSPISFLDIVQAIFKSVVYGFTIGITGTFKGFYADNGTVGVGKAATQAVVLSMFMIFIEELGIDQIFNMIRNL